MQGALRGFKGTSTYTRYLCGTIVWSFRLPCQEPMFRHSATFASAISQKMKRAVGGLNHLDFYKVPIWSDFLEHLRLPFQEPICEISISSFLLFLLAQKRHTFQKVSQEKESTGLSCRTPMLHTFGTVYISISDCQLHSPTKHTYSGSIPLQRTHFPHQTFIHASCWGVNPPDPHTFLARS